MPKVLVEEKIHDKIFPKDSVGSIMDPHYLSFREKDTVKDAVETIRLLSNAGVPLLYAYVVDDQFRLVGSLVMRDLLVSHDEMFLHQIMRRNVYCVNVNRNKDDAAKEAADKKYLAIPIVDDENRLLGALKFGDLMTYETQEQTKDVQKMFGAGSEETATSSVWFKIVKRLPWLKVNLITAFMAGAVIGLFEETIATSARSIQLRRSQLQREGVMGQLILLLMDRSLEFEQEVFGEVLETWVVIHVLL